MNNRILFELKFSGGETAAHQIDLYDVAQALLGFQRSLALTTHLVINDEIITQAPSLKGASILALPPEESSWKLAAAVVLPVSAAVYAAGTAPTDTVLGHLIYSAYDYVVNETLGFHVDFNESLGQTYEKLEEKKIQVPKLEEYRFDSLIDKCETAIRDIHRPISGRGTANKAQITSEIRKNYRRKVGPEFTEETFGYVQKSVRSQDAETIVGSVSSYNNNTFRGRVYVPNSGYPIPFVLMESARTTNCISIILSSLMRNSRREATGDDGLVNLCVHKVTSKTGRLKRLDVVDVYERTINR